MWVVWGADRPGWWDILPKRKGLHESCRMGRSTDADSLICSLRHCECDGHTVHKLSQRRLTARWLAQGDSDCSWMRSKVSSDWLPSYIKATRPVLEIFKMAGYFSDRLVYLEDGAWDVRRVFLYVITHLTKYTDTISHIIIPFLSYNVVFQCLIKLTRCIMELNKTIYPNRHFIYQL